MMARTKRHRRGYSAGERGRNRVRVFPDPKTGLIQIEWRDDGRRLSRSLKHRDWRRAKRQADEIAAGHAEPDCCGYRERSIGDFTSLSCSRTRQDTASAPSVSFDGWMSMWRVRSSDGVASTRRQGTST